MGELARLERDVLGVGRQPRHRDPHALQAVIEQVGVAVRSHYVQTPGGPFSDWAELATQIAASEEVITERVDALLSVLAATVEELEALADEDAQEARQ
jgi:hypothetical protein